MAVSWSPTTGGVSLNKVWKKSQGKLWHGFKTQCDEWEWLDDLTNFEIVESLREITVPVDLNPGYGSAKIDEGGYEAVPSTPNVEEVTLGWTNYNKRWSTTLTSRYLDQKGKDSQVIKQFKYQAIKAIEGLARDVGFDFYGYSTGILAENQTDDTQTSDVITIANAFGVSGLGNAAYLNSMFQTGERIALIDAGTLVTNALGTITDKDAATLSVTYAGSVDQDVGDDIVKANSGEGSTIAGTDYNKAPTGLLDMTTSASLYGLTHDNWVSAVEDTNGGRFSGVKLRQLKQAIHNRGGGKLTDIIWSNGVSNDVFALQAGALRFNDPFAMELDGDAKAKGVRFRTSEKVPPTCLFGYDKKSIQKFTLLAMPTEGGTMWEDGDKVEGRNAYAFSIDFPAAMVCKSRLNTGVYIGLTEQ